MRGSGGETLFRLRSGVASIESTFELREDYGRDS
jgi:hypothetical protein